MGGWIRRTLLHPFVIITCIFSWKVTFPINESMLLIIGHEMLVLVHFTSFWIQNVVFYSMVGLLLIAYNVCMLEISLYHHQSLVPTMLG